MFRQLRLGGSPALSLAPSTVTRLSMRQTSTVLGESRIDISPLQHDHAVTPQSPSKVVHGNGHSTRKDIRSSRKVMDRDYGDVASKVLRHELLSSIPIDLLNAELQRRDEGNTPKPSCGSTGIKGAYNVPAHVFALFLILIISTLACAFPIVARRFPELPIPHRFLFLSRHFGTGVLIATAFVHLLPTAFVSMTNPCLPAFWNERYQPMAGLIAMTSVFAVVTIEMIFASRGAGHTHESEWSRIPDQTPQLASYTDVDREAHPSGPLALHNLSASITHPHAQRHAMNENDKVDPSGHPDQDHDSDSDIHGLDNIDDYDQLEDPLTSESAHLNNPSSHKPNPGVPQRRLSHASTASGPIKDPQRMFLQCLLLEAGILFHSIFIGMAVSVARGTQFVVLLIAISFHQTFEGFALGARIAALIPALFEASSPKPWLMALAYGTTTPVGQALGLWLHRMYDPESEVGLLMVGITNAISSGLLLFAGLVQLIAEDFLSERSYEVLKGRRRVEASLAVGLGGLLMAVVGAFA